MDNKERLEKLMSFAGIWKDRTDDEIRDIFGYEKDARKMEDYESALIEIATQPYNLGSAYSVNIAKNVLNQWNSNNKIEREI
jgi:hypothetical protein